MSENFIWVSVEVIWGEDTREFRGQILETDLKQLVGTEPFEKKFLRMQQAYVVEFASENEAEVLKFGGRNPIYTALTGECYFRTDTILYVDLLKDGSEYFLDSE